MPSTRTGPSAPRALTDIEAAYHADPLSDPLALELGLAYANLKRPHDAVPLLQHAIRSYPKLDLARYYAGVSLLAVDRVEDGLKHLEYAFRLSPVNVARFINDGAAHKFGRHAEVRRLLARWSKNFQDARDRGYA